MHLFISEEEFVEIKDDAEALAVRADDYIRRLNRQVDNEKARAEAAQINAEQTCSLIEQKYLAVAGENANMEKEKAELVRVSEQRAAELVEAKAEVHRLQLDAIKHGSDLERAQLQVSELHAARRELLDLIERKNAELEEKNSAASSYLAKIVSLTNERSDTEAKRREERADLTRSQTLQARLEQEKDLLQQHNKWLRDELNSKNSFALEERHRAAQVEAELKAKLEEAERFAQEKGDAATKLEARVKDLQGDLDRVRQDFRGLKQESLQQGEQFDGELASAMKLVELYKESSEEWCGKANELEGVVKALETHIKQQEKEFEEKFEEQLREAETAAKEAEAVRTKLEADVVEAKEVAKRQEPFFPSSTSPESGGNLLVVRRTGNEVAAVAGSEPPRLVGEFSSTALAAMLLRDGWSLAKTYGRMVEVEDAWRHEKQKRLEAEHCLEMILYQIEEKAGAIKEERAEQQRLQHAYLTLQAKLEDSALTRERLEQELRESKAELDARKRENKAAGKVVEELQMQNVHLFKEIEVLQEVAEGVSRGDLRAAQALGLAWLDQQNGGPGLASPDALSGRQWNVSNIKDLVVENTELKSTCARLEEENALKDAGIQELRQLQLVIEEQEKHMEETNRRLQESAETAQKMQESTAMFKRLYEEEAQVRRSALTQGSAGELMLVPAEACHGDGGDYRKLLEETKAELQKLREDTREQNAMTKVDFDKAREDASSARIERAKLELEVQHYKEQLDLIRNEARDLRRDLEGAHRRTFEYSSVITTYQCKLREAQEAVHAAEEKERQSSFEVSVLEREKALLADAEKKMSEEVSRLSDKLHRVQASYDNIQQTQEAREATRADERKRLEDELQRLQLEWADGRRELDFERTRVRELTVARDKVATEAAARVDAAMKAAEEAKAMETAADTRARLSQARCEELEASLKRAEDKVTLALNGGALAAVAPPDSGVVDHEAELMAAVMQARREAQLAKEEAAADKEHAKQWKIIAERNEEAMKMSDDRHQTYKEETEQAKAAREAETLSLRTRLAEVQAKISETTSDFKTKLEEKNAALQAAIEEHAKLKEGNAKISRNLLDTQQKLEVLQKDSEEYHGRWREEHANFERQVILQAATIEELKVMSGKLEKAEAESKERHARAEKAEADLASLRVQWEAQVSSLQSENEDLVAKTAELENQNQLLLDRTEAMHILAAEDVRREAAETGEKGVEKEAREATAEEGLQEVVRYLRRSKQAADTELSLLKQERSRLQKQLEGANRALEDAQTRIRDHEVKASARVHTADEFAKLQAKIGQMALLEQSNNLLRAENQQNLRASEEWRRKAESLQKEIEPLNAKLLDKEIEASACRPEITRLEDEVKRWHRRVNELLEKYRTVDLEEHQRVKDELASVKADLGNATQDLARTQQKAAELSAALEAMKSQAEAANKRAAEVASELNESKRRAEANARKIAEMSQELEKLKAEKERFDKALEDEKNKGRRFFTQQKGKVVEHEKTIANLTKEKEALEAAKSSLEAERLSLAKEVEKANAQAKAATEELRQKAAAATSRAPVPPAQRPIAAQAVKKGLADAQAAKKAAAENQKKQNDAMRSHKKFLADIAFKAKERGEELDKKLELWNKEFAEWKSSRNKDEVEIPKGLLTEQQVKEKSDAYRSLLVETEMVTQQDFSKYAQEVPEAPVDGASAEAMEVVAPEAVKPVEATVAAETLPAAEPMPAKLQGDSPLLPTPPSALLPTPPSAMIVMPTATPILPFPAYQPTISSAALNVPASRPLSAASSVSIPLVPPGGAAAAVKPQERQALGAPAEQDVINGPELQLLRDRAILSLRMQIAEKEREKGLKEEEIAKEVAVEQQRKKARKLNRDSLEMNVDAPAPETSAPGQATSTGDASQDVTLAKPSGPSEPVQPSVGPVADPVTVEAEPSAVPQPPEVAGVPVSTDEPMAEAGIQPGEVKSELARLLKRPRESTEDTESPALAEAAPRSLPTEPDLAKTFVGTLVPAAAPHSPALPETGVGELEEGEVLGLDDPASKRPKLSTAAIEGTPVLAGAAQNAGPVVEDEIRASAAAVEGVAVDDVLAPQEALTEVIGGEMAAADTGEEVVSPASMEPMRDDEGNAEAMDVEAGGQAAEMAPDNVPTFTSDGGTAAKAENKPLEKETPVPVVGSATAEIGREGQTAPTQQLASDPVPSGLDTPVNPPDVSESAGAKVTLQPGGEAAVDASSEQIRGSEGGGVGGGEPSGIAAVEGSETVMVPEEASAPAPASDEAQLGGDTPPVPAGAPRIISLGGLDLEKKRQARMQGLAQAEVPGHARVTRSVGVLPPNPARLPSDERAPKKAKGRGAGRGRGDAATSGILTGQQSKAGQKSRARTADLAAKDARKEGDTGGNSEKEKASPPPPKTSNPFEALEDEAE